MSTGTQAPKTAPVSAPMSDLLQRVRAGQATLDEYLDYRADQAVAHLRKTLSAQQLELVRATIRHQLENDPVVIELVRCATGQEPSTAGDRG